MLKPFHRKQKLPNGTLFLPFPKRRHNETPHRYVSMCWTVSGANCVERWRECRAVHKATVPPSVLHSGRTWKWSNGSDHIRRSRRTDRCSLFVRMLRKLMESFKDSVSAASMAKILLSLEVRTNLEKRSAVRPKGLGTESGDASSARIAKVQPY